MNDGELFATLGVQHAGDLEDVLKYVDALEAALGGSAACEATAEAAEVSVVSLKARLATRAKAIRKLKEGT